ncbi:MAG: DJ-1/PfpI family protein [Candidatus Omnitrophica bacterium]|nr:DJ-1/PfpI family protein [Candidatus Omnitrophota bacterium]
MKTAMIPIADGFEEIETMTIVDVLRRAGLKVVLAGIKPGPLTGARRVQVVPDVALADVQEDDYDAVILPGGQPGVDNLRKDERVLKLLKRMKSEKKLIGAICAAPLILRDAGLIEGVRLTSYPGLEKDLPGSQYSKDRVVLDGSILTSRAPGTAMEFAIKLVEILVGKSVRDNLTEIMVVKS